MRRKEASAAAALRTNLERRGLPIGPLDNLIAGTAKVYQATLVTHNVGEFSRIAGLQVEDWYAGASPGIPLDLRTAFLRMGAEHVG